jgi:hypothetical protein
MHLGQNVKIFVLIHRSFISFVDEDVVFVSDFFDFRLHHSVVIIKAVISIFSFADS